LARRLGRKFEVLPEFAQVVLMKLMLYTVGFLVFF